jgi:hypothetical protein
MWDSSGTPVDEEPSAPAVGPAGLDQLVALDGPLDGGRVEQVPITLDGSTLNLTPAARLLDDPLDR